MPDTLTPVLGLVKPEINGAQTENVWGYDLNENFDKIDLHLAGLPASDAPLDGDLYGRRQGAWQRATMLTDHETLMLRVAAVEDVNDEQDMAIGGKAGIDHEHVAADITDLTETIDDQVSTLLVAGPNVLLQYDDVLGKLQISSSGGGEGGGGVGPPPDGDYGEITVTSFGLTWTIDPKVITYAKIQDVAADSLLGTVAAGRVGEIACTAAGRALIDDADAAAQRTTLGLSSMATEDAANFQHVDPTLTALAGLTGTGLVEQTGIDVFGKREIGIATPESLPTFGDTEIRYQAKDPTLTAFSFLTGTPGLIEVTGQDFFAQRAIGVGAATSIPTRADADARYALINSPVFTGDARCVTPATSDNDTSIATTAFVKASSVQKTGDSMTGPLTISAAMSATYGTFTGTVTGVASVWSGDMTLFRANSPGTGVLFLGNSGSRYLFWDGTSYNMPGGNLAVGGGVNGTSGTFSSTLSAPGASIANINCTNIAAANNVSGANGTFSGQVTFGNVHSYGTIYATTALTAGGAVSGGLGTFVGLQCNGDGNFTNTVTIAGPCYAGGFFPTGSDERLKDDLQPVANAQEILAATEVWDFLWTDGWRAGERDYGVMAQHAINVLPSAVHHDEEKDMWGVDYAKYVPILIAAVKELRAEIVELREQLGRGRTSH